MGGDLESLDRLSSIQTNQSLLANSHALLKRIYLDKLNGIGLPSSPNGILALPLPGPASLS